MGILNDQFKSMTPAQKAFVLSMLANKVFQNPKEYGLNEDGILRVGDKFDFTGLFEDAGEIKSIFDKARLTITPGSSQEKTILENNEKITNWIKNHPDEIPSEEKVSEILSDKPKIEEVVAMKTEPNPIPEQMNEPPVTLSEEIKEAVAEMGVEEIIKEPKPPEPDIETRPTIEMNQITREVEDAKARLAFLENSKNSNNVERSFNSDPRYVIDIEKAFNEEIDGVYGEKGLLGIGSVDGVDTKEWREIARLPANRIIEYYTGDSIKSGLPPEIIARLSESPKHGTFMRQMDGLIKQTDGVVKPFENENIEQFIKRLGGYILRTHLQKMNAPVASLGKMA